MPVDFPEGIFVTSDSLSPDLGVSSSRSEGGLIISSRRGDPFWQGRITTPNLSVWVNNNVRARFVAWLYQMVDLNMRINFVHPKHQYPQSYDEASWPMAGDAELVSVTDLRTVVVSDLTVGLILKQSDRISFLQGDIVVHRWIAEDVVVSSAISQTLTLAPRLPMGVLVAGAVAKLKNPPMRFVIVPDSIQGDDTIDPAPVSFEVSESLT